MRLILISFFCIISNLVHNMLWLWIFECTLLLFFDFDENSHAITIHCFRTFFYSFSLCLESFISMSGLVFFCFWNFYETLQTIWLRNSLNFFVCLFVRHRHRCHHQHHHEDAFLFFCRIRISEKITMPSAH